VRLFGPDGIGNPIPEIEGWGLMHKIDDIQNLRGVAILMVLTSHLSFSSTIFNVLPVNLSKPFFIGVELFFVISGYVVTRSLMNGGFNPATFFVRRVFRLYPPILAFLLLSLLINIYMWLVPLTPSATSLFGISPANFFRASWAILSGTLINYSGPAGYMNGAMWSLSVEFQFYAAAFMICVVAFFFRDQQRRIALQLFFLLAAIVYVLGVYGRIQKWTGSSSLGLGTYVVNGRFDFMALGVLLAYCPEKWLASLRRYGTPISIVTVVAPVVVLTLCRPVMSPPLAGPDTLDGFGMLFAGVCYVLLIAVASGGAASLGLSQSAHRILFWVGERSYTIYLLHFPCMILQWMVMYYFLPVLFTSVWYYAVGQVLIVVFILAPLTELVYRHIELPTIAFGGSLIRKWRSQHAVFGPA
jgi:peptidoglycan/LPS O-acetylase OafA/YrhL